MASLVPCKVCKKEVSQSAKVCPHCGEKNPGLHMGKGCLLAIVTTLMIALALNWMISPSIPSIDTDKSYSSRPYQIIESQDLGLPGRNRVRWFIRSDQATTELDRAATVIQATSDLIDKTIGANEVYIVLRNEKGDPLAMSDYVFDAKPKWIVQSASMPYALKPIKLK